MHSTATQIAHKSFISYIKLKVTFCCIFSQTPIGIENCFDLCSHVIKLFLPSSITVFWVGFFLILRVYQTCTASSVRLKGHEFVMLTCH